MPLELRRPGSLRAASQALVDAGGDGKIVAGGTALVLMLRQGLIAPGVLVSLADVTDAGYRGIESRGDIVRIGGGETLTGVAADPIVARSLPALAATCATVGNVRIRNRATLAGNLAEADYASDPPATLIALGARCVVVGAAGRREIPVAELITGFYETSLAEDEVIERIDVPATVPGTGVAYVKFRTRSSEDRPCVGVAAALTVRNGVAERSSNTVVASVRVVVGAVGEVPYQLPDVLGEAVGKLAGKPLYADIAAAYAERARPLDDARGSRWYRQQMIRVHVLRALVAAEREVRS